MHEAGLGCSSWGHVCPFPRAVSWAQSCSAHINVDSVIVASTSYSYIHLHQISISMYLFICINITADMYYVVRNSIICLVVLQSQC